MVNIGTSKKVDIDKMHAYRDAISDKNNNRVVDYAAILYPGRFESFGGDIEALSARPGVDLSVSKLRESVESLFRNILANK